MDTPRAARVRGGALRRSVRKRRHTTGSTFTDVIVATTATAAAVATATISTATFAYETPLEFLNTVEGVPVPEKRRRKNHEDMLNAPLPWKRLSLGKAMMKRDRLLQQKWSKRNSPNNAERNNKIKLMLIEINKTIDSLRESAMQSPTPKEVCKMQLLLCRWPPLTYLKHIKTNYSLQVYGLLDQEFATCPWPVPPSAILLHLPFAENRDKNQTRESVMRDMLSKHKKEYKWEFKEINPRVPQT